MTGVSDVLDDEAVAARWLARALDAFPEGLRLLDLDYGVIWTNAAASALLGLTREEMRGRKCYALKGRAEPCRTCGARPVYATGAAARIERYEEPLDTWFENRVLPLRDAAGELVGALEIFRAIDGPTES
jgi:PAS domain-containing protein